MPDDPSTSGSGKNQPARSDPSVKSALWAHVHGGTQLAASVLLGFYLGYRLDRRFGWSPWLTLAGAALGFAVGLYGFLRATLRDAGRK